MRRRRTDKTNDIENSMLGERRKRERVMITIEKKRTEEEIRFGRDKSGTMNGVIKNRARRMRRR